MQETALRTYIVLAIEQGALHLSALSCACLPCCAGDGHRYGERQQLGAGFVYPPGSVRHTDRRGQDRLSPQPQTIHRTSACRKARRLPRIVVSEAPPRDQAYLLRPRPEDAAGSSGRLVGTSLSCLVFQSFSSPTLSVLHQTVHLMRTLAPNRLSPTEDRTEAQQRGALHSLQGYPQDCHDAPLRGSF